MSPDKDDSFNEEIIQLGDSIKNIKVDKEVVVATDLEESNEVILLKKSKHVLAARSQRKLGKKKL